MIFLHRHAYLGGTKYPNGQSHFEAVSYDFKLLPSFILIQSYILTEFSRFNKRSISLDISDVMTLII